MAQEATPPEMDKYNLHVEEVEKITSLILGLSSRLAKTENNLANLKRGTWTEEEQASLAKKKEKLVGQLEEAKELKASIDRRATMVSRTMLTRLGEEQHAIYRTFIKTKVQLLVERTEAASLQLEALQKDS